LGAPRSLTPNATEESDPDLSLMGAVTVRGDRRRVGAAPLGVVCQSGYEVLVYLRTSVAVSLKSAPSPS
jgi:hypothetical protein